MAKSSCMGVFDVAAVCKSCQTQNTCPSCNQCQNTNSASCDKYNNCTRCDACNTRCNSCQSICETIGQVFTTGCGNSYPSDHWIDVAQNDIIVEKFSQGKFYWAWEWLDSAINYGDEAHSPGSSSPPSLKEFLYADQWNQINTVLASMNSGNGSIPTKSKDNKVLASDVVSAGNVIKAAILNKIACHYQNTVWDTCGPTSSECCQMCLSCNACQDHTAVPVQNQHYGCNSCNTCQGGCDICKGCNTCQGCNSCQGSCNSCINCNSAQSGGGGGGGGCTTCQSCVTGQNKPCGACESACQGGCNAACNQCNVCMGCNSVCNVCQGGNSYPTPCGLCNNYNNICYNCNTPACQSCNSCENCNVCLGCNSCQPGMCQAKLN